MIQLKKVRKDFSFHQVLSTNYSQVEILESYENFPMIRMINFYLLQFGL